MKNGTKEVRLIMEASLKLIEHESSAISIAIKEQQLISKRVYEFMGNLLRDETLLNAGVKQEEYLDDDYDELEDIISVPYITVAGGAPRDWYLERPARDIDMYILIKDFDKFFHKRFGEWPSRFYKEPELEREYFTDKPENRTPLAVWLGDTLLQHGFKLTRLKDKTRMLDNQYNGCRFMRSVIEIDVDGHTFDLIFFDSYARGTIVYKENNDKTGIEFDTTIEKFVLGDNPKLSFGEFVVATFDFNICKVFYDFTLEQIITCDYFVEDVENKTLTILQGVSNSSLKQGIFKHYPKLQDKFPSFRFNPVPYTDK